MYWCVTNFTEKKPYSFVGGNGGDERNDLMMMCFVGGRDGVGGDGDVVFFVFSFFSGKVPKLATSRGV